MEQENSSIDLRDLWWRLRRHGFLPLLPIIVALCGAVVYLKTTTPIFESQFTITMGERLQVSSALEGIVRADRQGSSPRERVSYLDGKIHSRPFMQLLVERLGVTKKPELLALGMAAASRWKGITPEEYALRLSIQRIGKQVRVGSGPASLIRVSILDTDPQNARLIANTLAELLVMESQKTALQQVQARGSFSADQIAVYEERLRRSEDALRVKQEAQIREQLNQGTGDPARLSVARRILRQCEEEIQKLGKRIQDQRTEWYAMTASSSSPPVLSSNELAALEARLARLETRHATAELAGAEGAKDVATAQTEIAAARQALFAEYGRIAQIELAQVSSSARAVAVGIALDRSLIRSVREKHREVSGLIGSYERKVSAGPRTNLEIQRLQEEIESNRSLLVALQREATSSRLSEALTTSELGMQVEVVEAPLLPLSPVSPSRRKVLGAGFLAGVLASIGLLLLLDRVLIVLRTPEQAEAEIGATVIGTMPRIEGWSPPGSFLKNHWPELAIVAVVVATGVFLAVTGNASTLPGVPR